MWNDVVLKQRHRDHRLTRAQNDAAEERAMRGTDGRVLSDEVKGEQNHE